MLRLRNVSGKPTDLPSGTRFIEILSSDGKLAAVVWQNDSDVVEVAKVGDSMCQNYARAFGLELARLVPIPLVGGGG
jgi:hypothetical protein